MAELKRRAAVHAAQRQNAKLAKLVFEQHDILTKNPLFLRLTLQLVGEPNRLPIPIFPTGLGHLRQHVVFFFAQSHKIALSEPNLPPQKYLTHLKSVKQSGKQLHKSYSF
jgi:hypothetical protein